MPENSASDLPAAGAPGAGERPGEPVPEALARPLRWGQLTLVEDDPGKCDIGWWLDYFRRTRCEGALLSAGGIVAYYPTDVPLHHRSDWLDGMDPLGELVAGCRELGMSVTTRVDPHAVRQEVCDAHPDWIAVGTDGQKLRHWSRPDMWLACTMGPYGFEHMTEVIKEIVRRYDVDGVFANRWASPGMCYCEHCAGGFGEFSGTELPGPDEPEGERWRSFVAWKQARLFALWDHWDQAVRSIKPEARFLPNMGGEGGFLDKSVVGAKGALFFVDHQGRSGLRCPWAAGKVAKEFRATAGPKPLAGICSVGVEEPHRWKDSAQAEAELRIWFADGIANGLRPTFTKFSATLRDSRWPPVIEDIFRWHHRCGVYMRNRAPRANVALVYSQQARWLARPEQRRRAREHAYGAYHALVEARIPFEMVCERSLGPEAVERYDALVFPSIALLSDEQCDHVRDYVSRGGSVVATYETSLRDETGEARDDFGLADLFGVRFRGRLGPMKNSYLRVEKGEPAEGVHPLIAGLEGADRIINGIWRLEVEPTVEFPDRPITFIPPYPDLPMEDVYPRVARTEIPEVYLREIGRGRIAYFNWDIDRTFWEVLNPDHGRLFANAVRWAVRDRLPVYVTGPGLMEVTAWLQEDSMTVHLVNLTNPMTMKGPYRELLPVGAQQVRVRLPEGRRAGEVRLLKAGEALPDEQADGFLVVTVPSVLDHEVVAIDLE
ncbi:MAG: beta-galactosidase trimerization domain-containing protein [Planctomycetota bacterium]|jgi:hypothetical protein